MKKDWEKIFLGYLQAAKSEAKDDTRDAAHDIGHFCRVSNMARQIALLESAPADSDIILAAAYFHDLVCLPKNHPESKFSSRFSAVKANDILLSMDFPKTKIAHVCHAIEAHSFSAGIPPNTIEAKIIQDADRMEALGALGIMRTFYVSGRMGSSPYHPTDRLAKSRPLDDKAFALDHFACKLFKLPDLLQTNGGRQVASRRAEFLRIFVLELVADLEKGADGGALHIVSACYEAGVKNGAFFDFEDVFAERRPLNPDTFVIDRLIECRDRFPGFIPQFLRQAKEEIISIRA